MYLFPFVSFQNLHFTSSILKYHSSQHPVGSCNLKSSLSIIGFFLTFFLGWFPTLFSLFLFCTHLSSLLALGRNRFLSLLWRMEHVKVLIGGKSAHFPDGWIRQTLEQPSWYDEGHNPGMADRELHRAWIFWSFYGTAIPVLDYWSDFYVQ